MKGGIGWKLITLALDRGPWKLCLMFLSREIDIQLCQIYKKNMINICQIFNLQQKWVDSFWWFQKIIIQTLFSNILKHLQEISMKKFRSGKNWLYQKVSLKKILWRSKKTRRQKETKQAPMAVQQIEKWRVKNRTLKNVIWEQFSVFLVRQLFICLQQYTMFIGYKVVNVLASSFLSKNVVFVNFSPIITTITWTNLFIFWA